MLEFLKQKANITYTENGAVTYRSSFSDCVDLFGTIGALRNQSNEDILSRFIRAYAENPDTAMKILFYARDIRGGLGERRVFRTIIRWLACNEPASLRKNLGFIAEYGRWDDLIVLLDTPCRNDAVAVIREQLSEDIKAMDSNGEVSLLAKWMPSVNASDPVTVYNAKLLARALGMSDAQYRKTLSALRAYIRIVENDLRKRDYSFDYSKLPSKALYKYRKVFASKDGERYFGFLDSVNRGEAVMHTGTLMPYDIVAPLVRNGCSELERKAADTTWNALEDFCSGENALAVIDGSGSMYCGGDPMPASVALSLGIYFAEHNTGMFRNHFITFSCSPQLVEIKGRDIAEKVRFCESFNEIADTNIQKVFELLLETAVKNRVPQEDMPSKLYIISDMEFNCCTRDASLSNFEYASRVYKLNGYKLPEIVFWNVNCCSQQLPVTMNEQGVVLVSGCSPRIFSMVISGEMSPYDFMMSVVGSERYYRISA